MERQVNFRQFSSEDLLLKWMFKKELRGDVRCLGKKTCIKGTHLPKYLMGYRRWERAERRNEVGLKNEDQPKQNEREGGRKDKGVVGKER